METFFSIVAVFLAAPFVIIISLAGALVHRSRKRPPPQ